MLNPMDALRSKAGDTDAVWAACRNALKLLHDIELVPDAGEAHRWLSKIEAWLGAPPVAEVAACARFAAELSGADIPSGTFLLHPHLQNIPSENAVALFHHAEAKDMLFGIDMSFAEDDRLPVWSLDYDRIPEDLNEDDPGDSLDQPSREIVGATPAEFVLSRILASWLPTGTLGLIGGHDEKERFDTLLSAALGPPVTHAGIDIYGGPGLLVTQFWSYPFDYRVDITALSREACAPLTEEMMQIIGMSAREFDRHTWPADTAGPTR